MGKKTKDYGDVMLDRTLNPGKHKGMLDQCRLDAESHCVVQAGGGFVVWSLVGSVSPLIPIVERNQFVEVIAEILWLERRGCRPKNP